MEGRKSSNAKPPTVPTSSRSPPSIGQGSGLSSNQGFNETPSRKHYAGRSTPNRTAALSMSALEAQHLSPLTLAALASSPSGSSSTPGRRRASAPSSSSLSSTIDKRDELSSVSTHLNFHEGSHPLASPKGLRTAEAAEAVVRAEAAVAARTGRRASSAAAPGPSGRRVSLGSSGNDFDIGSAGRRRRRSSALPLTERTKVLINAQAELDEATRVMMAKIGAAVGAETRAVAASFDGLTRLNDVASSKVEELETIAAGLRRMLKPLQNRYEHFQAYLANVEQTEQAVVRLEGAVNVLDSYVGQLENAFKRAPRMALKTPVRR